MWSGLEAHIRRRSLQLIREHEAYAKSVSDENKRRSRRSTQTVELKEVLRPESWSLNPGFDPYLTRPRAAAIAHAIEGALRSGSYAPRRPSGFLVPKSGGGTRTVTNFQIADEVVSRRVFDQLRRRNSARFSARSFAYRHDASPHDAIAYMKSEFRREHRLFVAEFDFSKFFDHVEHEHVLGAIDRLDLMVTPLELGIIRAFLSVQEPYMATTDLTASAPPRTRGLPQGTSISLFLANLAAAELDLELERVGVGFARYADDTVLWSSDFGRVTAAVEALYAASDRIGVAINSAKSPGIRVLTPGDVPRAEMRHTHTVDYLGHSVSTQGARIKQTSVGRIKARIRQLVYDNLLREPLREAQVSARVIGTDRDYITLIYQLRRYMYGQLSESAVRRYATSAPPAHKFRGAMAFFPLVDDDDQLRELDGWLQHTLVIALKKRARLLGHEAGASAALASLTPDELITHVERSTSGSAVDTRVPSFVRMASAIRRGVQTYGLGSVPGSGSQYLYGD
ncbi:reverse transcriptase domain-containing protein [Demequina globuliformis]|uniref:reverse transcriptase domain-containing protein n=1 Tax=Demequina globuliformis TaxID=676202 RepID=UPI0007810923|nr:reverse transcriptase domain-containing protein [Demequina globuliformis]